MVSLHALHSVCERGTTRTAHACMRYAKLPARAKRSLRATGCRTVTTPCTQTHPNDLPIVTASISILPHSPTSPQACHRTFGARLADLLAYHLSQDPRYPLCPPSRPCCHAVQLSSSWCIGPARRLNQCLSVYKHTPLFLSIAY
jgi:hypothetical protein